MTEPNIHDIFIRPGCFRRHVSQEEIHKAYCKLNTPTNTRPVVAVAVTVEEETAHARALESAKAMDFKAMESFLAKTPKRSGLLHIIAESHLGEELAVVKAVILLLVAQGAEINEIDAKGRTPLDAAYCALEPYFYLVTPFTSFMRELGAEPARNIGLAQN